MAFNHTIMAPIHGPAFLLTGPTNLKPLLYGPFVARLKKCIKAIGLDPKHFSSHSLRRGGATWAAQIGLPGEVIQMLGDWHSDAYLLYMSIPMSSKIRNMTHFYINLPKGYV